MYIGPWYIQAMGRAAYMSQDHTEVHARDLHSSQSLSIIASDVAGGLGSIIAASRTHPLQYPVSIRPLQRGTDNIQLLLQMRSGVHGAD